MTRRKSMTSTAVNNVAAIAAALSGAEEPLARGPLESSRRSFTLKSGSGRGPDAVSLGKLAGLIADTHSIEGVRDHDRGATSEMKYAMEGSAVVDEPATLDNEGSISKARTRRASEGAYLSRSEGKRSSGELRCEKCGKGYKHSSCLTKHLWEHTPEWTYTSKLLISKHQQVQLLEAASVLVGMNQDVSTPPGSAKTNDSDHSSASPAASGTSEPRDGDVSSAETTPPPISEQAYSTEGFGMGRSKRPSSSSSAFSRSYQSAPSSSLPGGPLPPMGTSFASYYQSGMARRPSTSGLASSNHVAVDEEEATLVAAVESLCSFGTPRSGPVHLPTDVPPVPPVPARFAGQNLSKSSANMAAPTLSPGYGMPPPSASTQRLSDERNVKMGERRFTGTDDDDDYDERSVSHGRSDEDDDGVFGRMEE